MGDVTDNAPLNSQMSLRRLRIGYLLAFVLPAAAVLVRYGLVQWTGDRAFQILFIIPIIVTAYTGGLKPGLLATAVTALAMKWFAVPPLYSLAFAQPIEVFYMCLLILVGILISALSGALHRSRADNRVERELRARAERALAELDRSEHLLTAIVDNSAAVIYVKDLQGRYLLINRRYQEVFHHDRAAILGKTDHELFAAEDADRFRAMDQRVAAGDAALTEEETVPLGDGLHTFVSVKSPLRDASGTVYGIFGISTDITERKVAQEAVRQSEVRYRTLFDTLIEGFCTVEMIFDANGKPSDYRFLEINPAFEMQTGLKDAHGRLVRDLVPDLEAHWFETFGRVALTGEPVHFESEAKPLGRHYDVCAYQVGGADGPKVAILFNDITARRVAEIKSRHQLVRLELLNRITRAIGERQDIQSIFQVTIRTLEANLPADFCCICLYDPTEQQLSVTSVGLNSAALAMTLALTEKARFAVDENGLTPCVHGQLVYEPDITRHPGPLAHRLAGGGLRSMVAAPLLVESKVFGVLLAARQQAQAFSSSDCEFLKQLTEHVALAAHQAELYTALQVAYDDLRQTQKAAMQQERLLALGQMASGIAHDINNAISPVTLYTEMLLANEPTLSPRARGHLETIQRAIDDVGQTVARMREFYRPRETQLPVVPVEMNRLVQQVVELTRARWGDMAHRRGVSIDMRMELAPDLPTVMGSAGELREALTNLIFNAVDAMPNGGPLTVRTAYDKASGTTVLEVIDSGVGMDENTRRRCLEPFFTTKGERGTGLGLAMVYGSMQRHGAEIEIDSAASKGTTMRLRFAASDRRADATAAVPALQAAIVPMRILIVDDDPLVLGSLRDALEGDGHDVTTADGGQAGIDTFRAAMTRGAPFTVVITDLGMPYVDGRKVSGVIKAAAPDTAVLLLTGWGQRLVAEGDIPPHVDCVLSKPAKIRELREALARFA
jgi:PAS domain S-box-containing protein